MQSPLPPSKPRLFQSSEVSTTWVTDCIAVGRVGGVLILELAEQRFDLGANVQGSTSVDRHIVARLAMTLGSFRDMVGQAERLGVMAAPDTVTAEGNTLN